ncbi:hypothetical protein GOODEAATRI_022593 [Goodea atripinnis]|uniref:Uncharacterized protein n=1 Tax=Goodea atripinnis TaxID=208336 RepID=A0ABV0NCT6_9TELE
MARRSSRLVSGGYYNSDEESDSSSVTNISYRENPVKVFKKKSGARKAASRTNSNASSVTPETPVTPGQSDSSNQPFAQSQSAHHEDCPLHPRCDDPSASSDSIVYPLSHVHAMPLKNPREEASSWPRQLHSAGFTPQTQRQGAESKRRGQLRVLVV